MLSGPPRSNVELDVRFGRDVERMCMTTHERGRGSADGDWFVDPRCINCGASRDVAPGLLVERHGQSVFDRQPVGERELRMTWMARELCPTRSIRSEAQHPTPVELYPHRLADGVYLCGHNARASYGAHSYFVERPDGNVLVDAPSMTRRLRDAFTRMGGIAKIVLTHRDDVADAPSYAAHFDADVYIHREDRGAAPFATHNVDGTGPEQLTTLGEGLDIIPIAFRRNEV